MYHDGWMDFNKYGGKDVFEDTSQPREKRTEDLLSQMTYDTTALEELRRDQKWLARASDAIVQYWRTRNGNKRAHRGMTHDAPGETSLTPPLSAAARN